MLAPGDAIPDVTVPATPGLCEKPTPLAELAAAGPIVLYSYPADGTPLCTRQACVVRDTMARLAPQIQESGVRVVGLSPQGEESHARFKERHDLPFPIIADTDKAILRALGAIGWLGMPRRLTCLLRPDGTVGDVLTADMRLNRHRAFLEAAVGVRAADG
ncbi:MAG: peroxiredoxin [Phycisphaerales bacterium JB060]